MAYSDDHPSFLFRVTEFIGAFPWRENYVPYWNAGVVNSVITSSGVASYSILGLPFWLTIPIEKAAPIVFLMIFVWMVPWVTYGGFRAAGFGRVGASLAGTLILGQSFLFYLWLLRFGTVGASLSMAMVPAVFAYLYSLLYQPKVSRWAFVGFLFSVVLMGQWPPMLVFGVPLGIWILVEWKRWWYGLNRWLFVGVAFAAAVLLVPTVVGALMGKEVLGHVLDAPEKPVVTWALAKKEFLTEIVSVCSDLNPLVLFAGLAWFCWLPWRRVRLWVCVIGFFVFSISAWGPMFLPNMQLARMGLAFSCLMVVPTVCVVRKILLARGILAPVVQAMVMALILCTFQNVARYYGGRTDNPFVGMRPIVHELADCVTELVPPDGRFLFAGASVHAYGRGHTAFLPKLADREMMGCDYYGFPRGMVEMNYPPHRFRTLPDGCYRFAKLWGVTHVIAYRPDQVAFYEADTTHFRRCRHLQDTSEHQNCEYVIFEVVEPDVGRFLKGSGEVKADFNRFEVTIDPRMTVGEEIVLRYNWHERLVAEGPVELYPYAVEPQEKLIGIRLLARPTEPIQIRYNSRF